MINECGFGKGSAIRALNLCNQAFRFEGWGGQLGALGGQEGLKGQTSDRERYRLDRAGCERVAEGRR